MIFAASGRRHHDIRADPEREPSFQRLKKMRCNLSPGSVTTLTRTVAANSCDLHQPVDLRPFKAEIAKGEATLELSAQFLDTRTVPGEPVRSLCRIYVSSGVPANLPAGWTNWQKDALATGSTYAASVDGTPDSWKSLTTRVLLPPQADFAIVAHKPVGNKTRTEPATFGEQFADDFRLTLETQPTLPVRLVPR